VTKQPESEDIYSGKQIVWRWVLVGTLVVLGTATLLGASLIALGIHLEQSLGTMLLVILVAFVIGGAITGWLSPGWTMWESGLASMLASLWLAFLALRLLQIESQALYLLPLGLLLGLGCGLLGGRLGERLQTD
jgi:hypothetical protein